MTTNDAFFGLDSLNVSGGRWLTRTTAPAYDAGSEANTESCDHIPGPPCGNPMMRVTEGAEGFIHIHPGLTGDGDIDAVSYGWQNPVVAIQVVLR